MLCVGGLELPLLVRHRCEHNVAGEAQISFYNGGDVELRDEAFQVEFMEHYFKQPVFQKVITDQSEKIKFLGFKMYSRRLIETL